MAAEYVNLRNERTGEIKKIKVGWNWIMFLFSGCLGIPLFLHRLYVWGGVMLMLWIVNLVGPSMFPDADEQNGLNLLLLLVLLAFDIFFGIKGNELAAKNYLENGWEWAEPDAFATRHAKEKWALA